jgi:transposase
MRYELTDHEWAAIKPMLPNKPRGVPRVNDRPCPERHLLGFAIRRTVARSTASVRPIYHLL